MKIINGGPLERYGTDSSPYKATPTPPAVRRLLSPDFRSINDDQSKVNTSHLLFSSFADCIIRIRRRKNRPAIFRGNAWKIWLVCGDCFLIGLAPVLVHMAKDANGKFAFSPISVNFLVEVAKTFFALGTLVLYGSGRPGPPLYKSAQAFLQDASHNRLLAVPAALYAVNNYLKFAMQLYFKPTTAKMLSNLKIIVIAMLMRSVMKRTFSIHQWEALFLLVAGITINQLNYCAQAGNAGDVLAPAAIIYTLGSITVPSLASVYNEFALKRHMDTSVLLQNFFLYFYGACFNFAGLLALMLTGAMPPTSMLTGFTGVTFLLVVNNAMQGILSSFFFKFADTILKKYSSTIATIFTGLMSALLFGHQLTLNFCIGVSIVFISMHLFFSLGGAKGKNASISGQSRMTVSPSMDHLSVSRVPSSGDFLNSNTALSDSSPLLMPQKLDNLLPR